MATFVLVHGAMHGGWCWRDVRVILNSQGHEVFTPTLTGQGERAHLLTPQIGLATHVQDIVALLEWENLSEVHLVLHSYAGVLAGPCVEESGGRIASITFVGAFLADDGESLLDVEPPETAERYRSLSAEEGDGWRIPASPAFLEQWGVTDPDLVAWIGPRLTDFPLACATDHVHFSQSVLERLQLFYVHHTDPPLHNLDTSHERAVQRGVTTFDVACGHDVMVEAPEELAGILQRIVS